MAKRKAKRVPPTSNEVRRIMLQYFYDRNRKATSARGKRGSAVKISDVKRELKETNDLTQQEVQSNLTYLISQGWVEEDPVEKSYTAPSGTIVPSTTSFYKITAAGIDKIEGPGEFTMPKFQGINIHATGQNIITLGDGNQIDAAYSELGTALVELRQRIIKSDAPEDAKVTLVADVDTIETQLAKTQPNRGIIAAAWESVQGAAVISGCASLVERVSGLIAGLVG